jgi:hypothetical protein
MLASNHDLLPSVVRSLFWILKEKHNKRRLVAQVEQIFLALPPMLSWLSAEALRRFVKGISDEARAIKQKLQQEAQAVGAAPQQPGQAQHAAHVPPVMPLQQDVPIDDFAGQQQVISFTSATKSYS